MQTFMPKWHGHAILAQACVSTEINKELFRILSSPIAMAASSSFVVDAIVPEETQGTMPAEAPATLGSSFDSFQHVEAMMKADDVSTSQRVVWTPRTGRWCQKW